jgi:hypothetical protein
MSTGAGRDAEAGDEHRLLGDCGRRAPASPSPVSPISEGSQAQPDPTDPVADRGRCDQLCQ